MSADIDRIEHIYKILHTLSSSQIEAIENIVLQLTKPYTTITRLPSSDIVDNCLLYMFGDSLRIHHCFSKEPLSKDRFEYALERSSQLCGKAAILAPKGNPGHDITINGKAISLKTEASANIKAGRVHISKFMELGKGDWNFVLLLSRFFEHLKSYDRILTLRCLSKSPSRLHYELVEIPKDLLEEARAGILREDIKSRQTPKPGYCDVFDSNGNVKFQLYFDGGTERKLQIRNISMAHCILHAAWSFSTEI
jgi:type II restriction enzyme